MAPSSFFFIALDYLWARIASTEFNAASATINHYTFYAVILFHIHTLWVTLIHWADDCERVPVYYRHNNDILMIDGVAPFSYSVASLDNTLSSWIDFVDLRFPMGLLNLANAFRDNISAEWDHIFLDSSDNPSPIRSPRASSSGRGHPAGNSNRPGSRAWAHNVFIKVESHSDCARSRNLQLVRAIRPFPRIKLNSGVNQKFCVGWACKGCQCLCCQPPCPMLHMSTRDSDLINASWSSMAVI